MQLPPTELEALFGFNAIHVGISFYLSNFQLPDSYIEFGVMDCREEENKRNKGTKNKTNIRVLRKTNLMLYIMPELN